MRELTNNNMRLKLVSIVRFSEVDETDNISLLLRENDNTYIVVNGLEIDENHSTCTWAFAYSYCIETLEEGTELLTDKVEGRIKP